MVDTHCHLEKKNYDIENIVNTDMIMISASYNLESMIEVLENIKYKNVYGVLGIHPENIEDGTDENLLFLENHLKEDKIIGIGEVGLDYHYTKEMKEEQKKLLKKQLDIARKYNLPVVMHSRDALEDTLEIIKEYSDLSFVLHCFGYSKEAALEFLKYNVMFGIGGVVTFKNSKKLKEVVKEIDMKHILLETDSPYLTPEPFRGHQNEPKNVKYVAQEIAKIKGISYTEVIDFTDENVKRKFDLTF